MSLNFDRVRTFPTICCTFVWSSQFRAPCCQSYICYSVSSVEVVTSPMYWCTPSILDCRSEDSAPCLRWRLLRHSDQACWATGFVCKSVWQDCQWSSFTNLQPRRRLRHTRNTLFDWFISAAGPVSQHRAILVSHPSNLVPLGVIDPLEWHRKISSGSWCFQDIRCWVVNSITNTLFW